MRSLRILSRRGTSRRGFALLMAVLLVAMAGLLLAGLAQHSLSIAMHSVQLHDELGRRWGAFTLEQAVSRQAAGLVGEAADAQGVRPSVGLPLDVTVRLDTTTFRVLIDDESRKLNLNRVFARTGRKGLVRTMSDLGLADVAGQLPPLGGDGRYRLRSWGQLFPIETIPPREEPWEWIRTRTSAITLWSNGRVHIDRAENRIVEAACGKALGSTAVSKLLALRAEEPDLDLESLLDKLALGRSTRGRLEDALTEKSDVFSLWIIESAAQRRESQLTLVDVSGQTIARFHW